MYEMISIIIKNNNSTKAMMMKDRNNLKTHLFCKMLKNV